MVEMVQIVLLIGVIIIPLVESYVYGDFNIST
jgi:hypothetical protein